MTEPGLFTLGVEEEFQIVDPQTRELKSHIQQIIEEGKIILAEKVKPEMHQSVVEIGTDICKDIRDARSQVTKLRQDLAMLAKKNNLRIAAAGTHPFSHWKDQAITEHPRYQEIITNYQQIARANLIFGLHVHVGVELLVRGLLAEHELRARADPEVLLVELLVAEAGTHITGCLLRV